MKIKDIRDQIANTDTSTNPSRLLTFHNKTIQLIDQLLTEISSVSNVIYSPPAEMLVDEMNNLNSCVSGIMALKAQTPDVKD